MRSHVTVPRAFLEHAGLFVLQRPFHALFHIFQAGRIVQRPPFFLFLLRHREESFDTVMEQCTDIPIVCPENLLLFQADPMIQKMLVRAGSEILQP